MTPVLVREKSGGSKAATILAAEPRQSVIYVKERRHSGVVAAGLRGARGADGIDGVSVSADEGNMIERRPDGLFAPSLGWASADW